MANEARDWMIDEAGRVVLEGGDIALARGRDGVRQNIRTALELAREEWFLDLNAGLPLFEEVLVKSPRLEVVRAAIRRTILSVAGVRAVDLTLDFDPGARVLRADFVAETDEGPITDAVTMRETSV